MTILKTSFIAFALVCGAAGARADEPQGCDAFKWPLGPERAALTAPDRVSLTSGDALPLGAAAHLALTPLADAKLDKPPERAPSDPKSFAGLVHLPTPPNIGVYKVTISGEGWIDLIQGEAFSKPISFSGAVGCDGMRKSVKFRLEGPATLQVTGAKTADISLIVTPE